jgi:HEAT repeat protein
VPYLVALHQRGSREVLDAAAALLDSPDELRRELGVRVLRELGPAGADGRRPYSAEVVALLRSRLHAEVVPHVLQWVISALGYHAASPALDDVLPFVSHPHPAVRFHVAAALPALTDPGRAQDGAVAALERLCSDEDADTRWYAFHALSQEAGGVPAHRITAVADALADDPDSGVRALTSAYRSS